MRPHQWVKNVFVLAPLLFGGKLDDPAALLRAILACGAFCLMSSGLYLVNDILDAPADRAHPEKRSRPLASGELPLWLALGASCVLVAGSLAIAGMLGQSVFWLALTYFLLITAYSAGLKRAIILDGMLIAAGFVLRVVAGAAAIRVTPSHWLILCAFLLALYLAFAKRRQELLILSGNAQKHRQVLGRYTVSLLEQINTVLLGSTVVCYALYTVAPETVARVGTDSLIYGTAFVLYGLLRYLALIHDSERGGNPSRLLVQDKPLILTVLGWAIFNSLVIYRAGIASFWQGLR
jgi:4-hydroxybenzoate polyprenyltransferase